MYFLIFEYFLDQDGEVAEYKPVILNLEEVYTLEGDHIQLHSIHEDERQAEAEADRIEMLADTSEDYQPDMDFANLDKFAFVWATVPEGNPSLMSNVINYGKGKLEDSVAPGDDLIFLDVMDREHQAFDSLESYEHLILVIYAAEELDTDDQTNTGKDLKARGMSWLKPGEA